MNKALTQQFGLLDPHEVKRVLSVPTAMRHFGWRRLRGKYTDCHFCQHKHKRHLTVSVTRELFYCHRCKAGGDVFALVQAELRCSFVDALRYLADLAGIQPAAPETREQYEKRKRERELQREQEERVKRAAAIMRERERELLRWIESYLTFFELARCNAKEALKLNPRDEFARECLLTTEDTVRHLDIEYRLLTFGSHRLRADYVLHPERRESIIAEIVITGIRDDDGHVMESSYV